MRTGRLALVATALAAALALAACAPGNAETSQPRLVADRVVTALKAKDGKALSALVHPRLGVRFSPYASVDTSSDVVLSPEDVSRLWEDPTVRLWGSADGTGDPIALTGADYARRYVWDRDFTKASAVSVNADRASGNTVNNAAEVYRDGIRVEYYLDASTTTNGEKGNDWAALRLVFERSGEDYYLVGVIHDQWTI